MLLDKETEKGKWKNYLNTKTKKEYKRKQNDVKEVMKVERKNLWTNLDQQLFYGILKQQTKEVWTMINIKEQKGQSGHKRSRNYRNKEGNKEKNYGGHYRKTT